MIKITDKKDCCGCNACVQRCPKQCITMHADNEGFLYPVVNTEKCIDCGLCEKVCPVINQEEPQEPIKVFAAYNKDEKIREQSSSGGIFTLLAEETIKKGGVVFGVKFNREWMPEFGYTETIEGIAPFRGSKYTQAIVGNAYKHAEDFLKIGRFVLFSGTPCQIAGLRRYLRKEYSNLLTVDIICHGVPSPKVWDMYLKETCPKLLKSTPDEKIQSVSPIGETYKSCIEAISFRSKITGWKKFSFLLKLNFPTCDGKNTVVFTESLGKNNFMRAFLSDTILRPSCYACPTKHGKSHSDITIADAWGIEHIAKQYDDDKGACYILENTDKGKAAMSIQEYHHLDVDFQLIKRYNPAWMISAKPYYKQKLFYKLLSSQQKSLNEILDKTHPKDSFWERIRWSINKRLERMKKPLKVLIIGTGSLRNYGCEAIVQGTYQILRESVGICEITVASDDFSYDSSVLPSDIKLVSYKQRFTLWRLWKGLLRRFLHIGNGSPVRMNTQISRKYDVILSCGGDNYCEAPNGTIYTILEDLMEIGRIAKKQNKKYVLWGASVGPFKNSINHKKVLSNLELADLITVREKLSYQYLSSNKKVRLVADPAFKMKPDCSVTLNRKKGKFYIGINVSLLSISHAYPDNIEERVEAMFMQLDKLLDLHHDWCFVCIPHVMSSSNGAQNDYVFMKQYLDTTKHKDRVTILPDNLGAKKTKGYIAQLDLLVAARMHCCVAGISVGTPTLFITYSNKGKGMSEYAYTHHDYELEVHEIFTDNLEKKICKMRQNAEGIKEHLKNQQPRFIKDSTHGGYLLDNCIRYNK